MVPVNVNTHSFKASVVTHTLLCTLSTEPDPDTSPATFLFRADRLKKKNTTTFQSLSVRSVETSTGVLISVSLAILS